MKKIPLVYILGMGRSGSTLLDMLLGGHKTIANTGEFSNFAKWLKEDDICTCKEKIRLCPVWAQVIKKCPHETAREPMTPYPKNKWLILLQLVYALIGKPLNQVEQSIAKKNRDLFESILETCSADYIVDSSKAFFRLCFLERSGFFDLKIIYLVRDGRGVANSKKVKKNLIKRQWNLQSKQPRPVFWTARLWSLTNLICLILCATRFKKNSIRIRYEDLALKPQKEMERVAVFIGVDPLADYSRLPDKVFHSIAGNSSRFSNDRLVRLDERWIEGLSCREKCIFALTAGWMNWILGYGIFGRRRK
jgi:hypothetical protein